MAGVDYADCVESFGGFQGLSADEQVETSEIDNSLISSVNEQFATHRSAIFELFCAVLS